jgi:hypothetical protein
MLGYEQKDYCQKYPRGDESATTFPIAKVSSTNEITANFTLPLYLSGFS